MENPLHELAAQLSEQAAGARYPGDGGCPEAKKLLNVLFNSHEFIFGFLPVVFAGFFLIAGRSHRMAAAWLAAASLFFYAWTSLKALPLLLLSVGVNYAFGRMLTPAAGPAPGGNGQRTRRVWLVASIGFNLSVLAFFKYANFIISNLNAALGALDRPTILAINVALPTGISFYTFTQIAFLVDSFQGKVRERNFTHYLLFVTYFPHLIAGPVLHHKQMMPQFADPQNYRPRSRGISIGLLVFTIGLAKKVLIADPLGGYADSFFESVDGGAHPALLASWRGTLAYTFQIYFDFSGYSDMAIGLSALFGISLPSNFNSPYKARSIIEFWRRWHISLSTFLRDYLYIPLGGNRLGKARRHFNLFVTMLLGGLWHGANWTFVLWGAAHGVFLIVNHAWQRFAGADRQYGPIGEAACWLVTFVSVCFAWVLFRAEGLTTTFDIYRGLVGLNGTEPFRPPTLEIIFLSVAAGISLLTSNATEITAAIERGGAQEKPVALLAGACAGVAFFACLVFLRERSQFIYFNF